ncbi:uncharacterized protein LOC119728889 [Patiria miniata]|uniref:Uncharacterized protein n=1 Tax=Patiria miniata TaxID=46514 RepID=A0A914A1L9_PATMI|nr:uncharacterized protein LOC119728889 [Patiria miniata]
MKESGTLVTDNPNLNGRLSASLSNAKEKSASKALMGLKHLKADDIGVLRYTRSSEFGTQVKCSNHAHDVSSRKQVNMWHRDQRIAVDKLARGQQKMFRNLIRVQNEKRRIQRQARIRKQREMQIELRERAVREREEAQKRLRDMIMTEVHSKEVPEDDEKTSPRPLPGIREEIDTEMGDVSKGDANNSALTDWSINSIRSSLSGDNSPVKTTRQSSTTPKTTSSRSPSATQTREVSQVLETVSKANLSLFQYDKEKSVIKESGMGLVSRPHFSREAKQSMDYNSNVAGDTDVRHSVLDFEKDDKVLELNSNIVLPGIVTKIPKDPPSQTFEDGASYESNDSVFEGDVPTAASRAKDQTTTEKTKRKPSERAGPKSKYHIGIANRTFRLPEYQAPVVTSVVRYQRNSAGSLVPSEVAVKPASEEYKLPSRRAEYMVEKALEWERRREDVREKKLQGFLERMKELERREKMESRLATSLDYARHDAFHHHHQAHHTVDRATSPPHPPTYRTLHRSAGEALEKYHLKGDVQDVKNCRYLRLNDKGEASREDRGKMGGERGRRGRRMSSWGMVGAPHGDGLSTSKLPPKRGGQHKGLGF